MSPRRSISAEFNGSSVRLMRTLIDRIGAAITRPRQEFLAEDYPADELLRHRISYFADELVVPPGAARSFATRLLVLDALLLASECILVRSAPIPLR
jgi:hypothetical protein